ncbi:MAG: DUF4275 family protein [Clostridiales bacterium]|nr:DUF4275 family protein [Clostridiales bacterium]
MNKKEKKTAIKKLRAIAKNNSNYKKNPFFARWLKEFGSELTDAQYRKYIHKKYIWHAFSYNIIPKENYLEGDAAREAYNKANKTGAICLQLDFEDTPTALTEEFDTAEKLEGPEGWYAEFYVVGENYSWTYIVTHETDIGIGPYFMEIKK